MAGYKHIERTIGRYIARHYRRVVEVGIGTNSDVARALAAAGLAVTATDIRPDLSAVPGVTTVVDDICAPDPALYRGADLIYAVRPGIEMVPAMLALARAVDADLLVYHLGFEIYGDGGEVLECGVPLHRYHRRSRAKD